jgi:isoprenylcysteine carboxyl methyltransferase (ICMT) family protein YpbQ
MEALKWPLIFAATGIHLFGRIGEIFEHRSNVKFLRLAGADDLNPRISRISVSVGFLLIPLMVLESHVHNMGINLFGYLGSSAILLLTMWFRFSLIGRFGRCWNLYSYSIPHVPLIKHPVQRFIKHPEYLTRILDTLALGILMGAHLTMIVGATFQWILFWQLSHKEEQITLTSTGTIENH